MRYRVDFIYGSASWDESQKDKALAAYSELGGVRMRRCRDIHDEGTVIMGAPIVEDLTLRPWAAN